MLPDDALDRLNSRMQSIAKTCRSLGIAQWEIRGMQSYGHEIDIEADKITLAGGGGEGGFGVRVVENGSYGFAHMVDATHAQPAIEQAIKIARLSPKIADFTLPEHRPSQTVQGQFDSHIIDLSPQELLQQADDMIRIVKDDHQGATITGGGIGVSATASAMLTSEGIEGSSVATSHSLGVQVSIGSGEALTSAYDGVASRHLLSVDHESIHNAVHWAEQTQNPLKLDQDAVDAPVLFTSKGFAPLFSMVVPPALYGERLARKESLWADKQGQRIMADDLTIIDDGLMEGGFSSGGRDGEGVPRSKQTLVQEGKLVGSFWSTRDAAQQVADGRVDAAESTGSASYASHQSPPSTGCSELILTSTKGNTEWDQLIESIEQGYVVNSVMGAHTANPTSGDFSVTTSSILKVVDGEIVGALKQAGLSGNISKALGSDVALGDDVRQQSSYSSGTMHMPSVLLQHHIRVNPA